MIELKMQSASLANSVIAVAHKLESLQSTPERAAEIYSDILKLRSEAVVLLDRIEGVIRTYHDETCPKCGFPETVIVRMAETLKPVRIECSKYCGFSQEIKSKEDKK